MPRGHGCSYQVLPIYSARAELDTTVTDELANLPSDTKFQTSSVKTQAGEALARIIHEGFGNNPGLPDQ